MIQHIVLIKFLPSVTDLQIEALWSELVAIEREIDGLTAIRCGKSESPEKIERGYLHGFVAEFEDWAALERYQTHPKHQALGAKLIAHAAGGLDGILVFDLPSAA